MKITRILPTLAAAALLHPAAAHAQVGVEGRAGLGIGNNEAAASGFEMEPGPAFAVLGTWRAMPMVSMYAGYTHTEFGCSTGFCVGYDVTFVSSGISAGLRVHTTPRLWLQAGFVRQRLTSRAAGDVPFFAEGDPGMGFSAGAGLAVPLTGRVSLTPGIAYQQYVTRDEFGSETLSNITADVGVQVRLF